VNGISQGSVNGISQGSVNGISQGSVNGISQGSVNGISQGSVNGISQGSVNGISQGSVNGISQGSVNGISQGSVNGISQGSVNGISQGSVNGISQGSVDGISQGSVSGISPGSVESLTSNQQVLAGPVASIDRINGVFVAMGQTVMASNAMLSHLQVGDFVSVNGSVVTSGWLYADTISVSDDMYAAGATEVFVTGIPSRNNLALGQMQLGDLTIDYTAALSGGSIPSGLSLSFRGIQPVNRGLFVSDAVSVAE
jgi:hypothetical protein